MDPTSNAATPQPQRDRTMTKALNIDSMIELATELLGEETVNEIVADSMTAGERVRAAGFRPQFKKTGAQVRKEGFRPQFKPSVIAKREADDKAARIKAFKPQFRAVKAVKPSIATVKRNVRRNAQRLREIHAECQARREQREFADKVMANIKRNAKRIEEIHRLVKAQSECARLVEHQCARRQRKAEIMGRSEYATEYATDTVEHAERIVDGLIDNAKNAGTAGGNRQTNREWLEWD